MKSTTAQATLVATLFFTFITGCTRSNGGAKTEPGPGADEPAAPAATDAPASGPTDDDEQTMATLRDSCPMVAEGVSVAVADTDTGVALTFTTETGDIDDLRQRARHMAQMYEMHQGDHEMMWRYMHPKGGHGPMHGGGGMMHGGGGPMPAVQATVEDVDQGARISLQPKDSSELDALRERVRTHQARMQAGECWMSKSKT